MATPTDIEHVSYGGPKGSLQLGAHRNVIQGVGATRTLLAGESGSLCLFDRLAGNVFTLPAPVEGMIFEFLTILSHTSVEQKVITDSAGVYLVGAVTSVTIATASPAGFSANGTTIISIKSNGTTTGGLIGSSYTLTALNPTQWGISGVIVGSGTIATPFSTT